MSDGYIQVPVDSAGKKVDAEQLSVNGQTVLRQRINLSDPTTADGHVRVKNAQPASDDYGLTVRQAPAGLLEAAIDISSATDTDVIAGHANGLEIWKLVLRANGDQNVAFKNGATVLIPGIDLAQGGEMLLPKDEDPWFTCSANQPFRLTTTGTGRIVGRVYYRQG